MKATLRIRYSSGAKDEEVVILPDRPTSMKDFIDMVKAGVVELDSEHGGLIALDTNNCDLIALTFHVYTDNS